MAADNQMDPADLLTLVEPVARGEVDYAKANRLVTGEAWKLIPRTRYLGNAILSLLTKIASGYWHVADSQTGYTAISKSMLAQLDLDRVYPGYGFPNDMLVHLNVWNARVRDFPSRPVYGVGEQSGIKLRRVVPRISWLLVKGFFWRLREKYVIRDFHPLVFFYALGLVMTFAGLLLGAIEVILRLHGERDHDADDRPRRAAPDLGQPVHALRDVVRHGVEQGPALSVVRVRLPLVVATVLTAALAILAVRTLDAGAVWDALRKANLRWLVPSLFALAAAFVIRAVRWRLMFQQERRPPLGEVIGAGAIGLFFNAILPFRAGELARLVVLHRRTHVPRLEILGTIATERIYDVLALLILLAAAVPWLPDVSWLRAVAVAGGILALAAAALSVTLLVWGERAVAVVLWPLRFLRSFPRAARRGRRESPARRRSAPSSACGRGCRRHDARVLPRVLGVVLASAAGVRPGRRRRRRDARPRRDRLQPRRPLRPERGRGLGGRCDRRAAPVRRDRRGCALVRARPARPEYRPIPRRGPRGARSDAR